MTQFPQLIPNVKRLIFTLDDSSVVQQSEMEIPFLIKSKHIKITSQLSVLDWSADMLNDYASVLKFTGTDHDRCCCHCSIVKQFLGKIWRSCVSLLMPNVLVSFKSAGIDLNLCCCSQSNSFLANFKILHLSVNAKRTCLFHGDD